MLADLPVIGICGWSGAGTTFLIEAAVPHLRAQGLRVAVVKHDVHGIAVDPSGKDSDRLFRSGADVLLQGPAQELFRAHVPNKRKLKSILRSLCRRYDLVLVEGHKDTPIPKFWLLTHAENTPLDKSGIVAALPWGSDRVDALLSILNEWLPRQWQRTQVLGCVLTGSSSSHTGLPKDPRPGEAKGCFQRTVDLLSQVTQRVVIVRAGDVANGFPEHLCLPPVTDAVGPAAGLLAVMRWAPWASWLVVGSDFLGLTLDALRWLLSTRAPGVWATLPRLRRSSQVEPVLAHYDFRSCLLLEELAANGDFDSGHIASSDKVISPCPPPCLAFA